MRSSLWLSVALWCTSIVVISLGVFAPTLSGTAADTVSDKSNTPKFKIDSDQSDRIAIDLRPPASSATPCQTSHYVYHTEYVSVPVHHCGLFRSRTYYEPRLVTYLKRAEPQFLGSVLTSSIGEKCLVNVTLPIANARLVVNGIKAGGEGKSRLLALTIPEGADMQGQFEARWEANGTLRTARCERRKKASRSYLVIPKSR